MRAELPIWLVISDIFLGGALCYFLWHWRKEWLFYTRNERNYLIDNPDAKHIYKGEYVAPSKSNRMSNWERLHHGYPFFILVLGVLFLGFLYFIYCIQTCPFDDLKKCGIDVKNGSVTIGG